MGLCKDKEKDMVSVFINPVFNKLNVLILSIGGKDDALCSGD